MIPSGVNGTLAAIQDARRGKQRYAQQKASRAEQQKREKRLAEVERQIARLETRKTAIEAMMGDGTVFGDPQQAREITAEYESLTRMLEEEYRVWSTVAEEMEA
jgi:ATP-binding cassette subfamily F protein 3